MRRLSCWMFTCTTPQLHRIMFPRCPWTSGCRGADLRTPHIPCMGECAPSSLTVEVTVGLVSIQSPFTRCISKIRQSVHESPCIIPQKVPPPTAKPGFLCVFGCKYPPIVSPCGSSPRWIAFQCHPICGLFLSMSSRHSLHTSAHWQQCILAESQAPQPLHYPASSV